MVALATEQGVEFEVDDFVRAMTYQAKLGNHYGIRKFNDLAEIAGVKLEAKHFNDTLMAAAASGSNISVAVAVNLRGQISNGVAATTGAQP